MLIEVCHTILKTAFKSKEIDQRTKAQINRQIDFFSKIICFLCVKKEIFSYIFHVQTAISYDVVIYVEIYIQTCLHLNISSSLVDIAFFFIQALVPPTVVVFTVCRFSQSFIINYKTLQKLSITLKSIRKYIILKNISY